MKIIWNDIQQFERKCSKSIGCESGKLFRLPIGKDSHMPSERNYADFLVTMRINNEKQTIQKLFYSTTI